MAWARASLHASSLRIRSVVPSRHAPGHTNVTLAPRRNSQRVSAASLDPLSAMAEELLEKEEQLRAMFQPGKKMPRAAVVSKLRKDIARLRGSLQGAAESGALPADAYAATATSDASTTSSSHSAASGSAAPVVGLFVNEAPEAGVNRAHQILMEVEAKLKVQQIDELEFADYNQHPHHSASRVSVEMARLEAENKRLRRRANALLSRQAALEEAFLNYFGREWVPSYESVTLVPSHEEEPEPAAPAPSILRRRPAAKTSAPKVERLAEARKWVKELADTNTPALGLAIEADSELISKDPSWLVTERAAAAAAAAAAAKL